MRRITLVLTLNLFLVFEALAAPKLAALFTDHAVFQRDSTVPIWGWAEPNEALEVELFEAAGDDSFKQVQEHAVTAGGDGGWMAWLDPLPAGGPYMLAVTGAERVRVNDIYFGEVWVASGQSNMQWSVNQSGNAAQEIAGANYPKMRLFQVPRVPSAEPLPDVEAQWQVASSESVKDFSAVAYYFGRHLLEELDVPIGLIHTSWGGTPSEAWTRVPALVEIPIAQPILDRSEQIEREEHRPARLWNGMVAPLVPYAIKGAIWYQGESNASRAYQYREIFPAMIRDWRAAWGKDFPFLFVQLANFRERKTEPAESDWAELREAQNMALQLPETGTALAIDIGDAADIHPTNKQEVGRRLGLAALGVAYDQAITYSGPMYNRMAVEGDEIRLWFDHVDGGLVSPSGPLRGFAIAGADKQFHWANAEIDGETVVVSSPLVEQPVAVRYGWADNPEVTLYNRDGLPASPFRTDDWPGVTVNNR